MCRSTHKKFKVSKSTGCTPRLVTHSGQTFFKFEINFNFDVPSRLIRIWPYLHLTYADSSIMWKYMLNVSSSQD